MSAQFVLEKWTFTAQEPSFVVTKWRLMVLLKVTLSRFVRRCSCKSLLAQLSHKISSWHIHSFLIFLINITYFQHPLLELNEILNEYLPISSRCGSLLPHWTLRLRQKQLFLIRWTSAGGLLITVGQHAEDGPVGTGREIAKLFNEWKFFWRNKHLKPHQFLLWSVAYYRRLKRGSIFIPVHQPDCFWVYCHVECLLELEGKLNYTNEITERRGGNKTETQSLWWVLNSLRVLLRPCVALLASLWSMCSEAIWPFGAKIHSCCKHNHYADENVSDGYVLKLYPREQSLASFANFPSSEAASGNQMKRAVKMSELGDFSGFEHCWKQFW